MAFFASVPEPTTGEGHVAEPALRYTLTSRGDTMLIVCGVE
jgi:hypothetical protein